MLILLDSLLQEIVRKTKQLRCRNRCPDYSPSLVRCSSTVWVTWSLVLLWGQVGLDVAIVLRVGGHR